MLDATHTLFHDTNEIKQAPTARADLWDPANKDKIAIPLVTWSSGVRMAASAAQMATEQTANCQIISEPLQFSQPPRRHIVINRPAG